MRKYKNISDWQKDMDIITANPDDSHFILKVAEKVRASDTEVQRSIQDQIEGVVMEESPLVYFRMIAAKHPNSMLFIKDSSDPYFEV